MLLVSALFFFLVEFLDSIIDTMSAAIPPMNTRPLGSLKLVQNDNILFALLQIVELHGAHLDQEHGKGAVSLHVVDFPKY